MKFGRAVLQSAAVIVLKSHWKKFLERHPHSKDLSDPLTLQLTLVLPTATRKVLKVVSLWLLNSWELPREKTTDERSGLQGRAQHHLQVQCARSEAKKPNYPCACEGLRVFGASLSSWAYLPHGLNLHDWCYQTSEETRAVIDSVWKCHETYSWIEYGGREIIPAHSEALFIRRGFLSLASLLFDFDVILKKYRI